MTLTEAAPRGMRLVQVWLAVTDLMVILWATFGAKFVRFGVEGRTDVAASLQGFAVDYTTFSLVLALVWWLSLRVHGLYRTHLLGHGAAEYRLLGTATLSVFAAVALVAFALQIQVARGYILLALPAGLVGLFVARRLWRRWLGAKRVSGQFVHDVLVVGEASNASGLIGAFASVPEAGYRVIGVCTSTTDADRVDGVPVLGSEHEAAQLAIELGVDVVACGAVHRLGSAGLRRLGWALEGSGIELVVSPGLTEIAGPRVLTRPVAGLPLLYVEAPKFSGPRLIVKSLVDWLGALLLLIVMSPLMLVVAALVKLHDGGPVFFRQERVGLDGDTFRMFKFRSMVPDAEERLEEVKCHARERVRLAVHGDGRLPEESTRESGVLFKMEDDPRVTPLGRFIRRYSIDELPQLFDVLAGRMSLVGPRPPLPSEVLQYEHDGHRRLLVRPGMTGLWQVNGRSNLTWEQSVRFDLYYVENWSVALDGPALARQPAAPRPRLLICRQHPALDARGHRGGSGRSHPDAPARGQAAVGGPAAGGCGPHVVPRQCRGSRASPE